MKVRLAFIVLGMGLIFSTAILNTTEIKAFSTESGDICEPVFDSAATKENYTIRDDGDGSITLDSEAVNGYELFTLNGKEYNNLTITQKGTTAVYCNRFSSEGKVIKTYKINVVIGEEAPPEIAGLTASIWQNGKQLDSEKECSITSAGTKVELRVRGAAAPSKVKIVIEGESFIFTKTGSKVVGSEFRVTGSIKPKDLTKNVSETLGFKVSGAPADKTGAAEVTASLKLKYEKKEEKPGEKVVLAVSGERLEIKQGEKADFSVTFGQSLKREEWTAQGYVIKVEAASLVVTENKYESAEDPFSPVYDVTPGKNIGDFFLTVKLFKDGELYDSKVIKVRVLSAKDTSSSGAGSGSGSGAGSAGAGSGNGIGDGTGSSNGSDHVFDEGGEQGTADELGAIRGLVNDSDFDTQLAALGKNESLQFDMQQSFRISPDNLDKLQGTTNSVEFTDKKKHLKITVMGASTGATGAKRDYYDFSLKDSSMLTSRITKALQTKNYLGAVDVCEFNEKVKGELLAYIDMYTFIRDNKSAFIYYYDEEADSFTELEEQLVENNHIMFSTQDLGCIVVLEERFSKIIGSTGSGADGAAMPGLKYLELNAGSTGNKGAAGDTNLGDEGEVSDEDDDGGIGNGSGSNDDGGAGMGDKDAVSKKSSGILQKVLVTTGIILAGLAAAGGGFYVYLRKRGGR